MRRLVTFCVLLTALVTAANACTSGGGAKTLSTGTYTLSASGVPVDGCAFGTTYYFNDDLVGVTVGETNVDMIFLTGSFQASYRLTGTMLVDTSASAQVFDFNILQVATVNGLSRTYDCVHTRAAAYTGEVIAKNTFTLDDTYEHTNAGPECNAVVASNALAAPCITTLVTTATK